MNLSALQAALVGSIGANDEVQEPKHFLDTGIPELNMILSGRYDGGVPYGRIMEIFGPSSSGKTFIATLLMIAAQRAGGIAMFSDHERSFMQSLAAKAGLDTTPGPWIYKRHRTWEEANTELMKMAETVRSKGLIAPEAPIIGVFDSVAAMIPQSVFEKGISEYSMNDTTALARVSSTTLKAINQICADLNVIPVYLNQIRTKPGVMYGDPTSTPGGVAFEFFSTIRLALGRSIDKDKKTKEVRGQSISVLTKKNKIHRPFQKVELQLVFTPEGGAVFDLNASLLDHLIMVGALKTSGSYVEWVDGKKYNKGPLLDAINSAGESGRKVLKDLLPKHKVDLTEHDHEEKTGDAEGDGKVATPAAA
ncbi:DNA recombination/repair protein RecA [Cupriavidus metallidurans]|uniref:DNA recombination/repair protein RecA n=1 Tax=Cupriavidus metallidurans TaxID=119219 RepID=UPI001CCBE6D9|nr:DNA recombination/repair protein RecA [Cupriavidus metallidurans]UBM12716.1 DNA recombination/repair protein RecA [Cupriavidus metallidurans]